jgi:CRP-like cAMP-binding protein
MENVSLLKKVALFKQLNDKQLQAVAKICEEKLYDAGEVLFEEGAPGDVFYLICSGVVKITKRLPGEKGEKTICRLGKDDFFGEMALVDGGPRSAKAEILESAILIEIPRKDFQKLVSSPTQIAFKILKEMIKILSQRLRRLNDHYCDCISWAISKCR